MKLMIKFNGRYREASPYLVREAAARYALRDINRTPTVLDSPSRTSALLQEVLKDREYEVFCCLFLDNHHRLIDFVELFRGTVDGASVHPREVAKEALARNAAAVIIAHNHPSGVAEPSQADELITRRLRDALALLEIRLIDHFIVAGSSTVSLAEKGLL